MSDLRDRIAAVLRQELFGNGGDGDVEPEALADAVIAALNLTTPVEYLSVDQSKQNYIVAGHYTQDVNHD